MAKARAVITKPQANTASVRILLESLISILHSDAAGDDLAEQRLARMELACGREAFQLWLAMIMIWLFDRSRLRRSDAFGSGWAQVHLDCCGKLRVDGFDLEMGIASKFGPPTKREVGCGPRRLFPASDGMTGIARTPVLPKANPLGAITAL